MRTRLLRNALIMVIVPLTSVILASNFDGYESLRTSIVLLGILAQIAVILYCMHDARRLFHPATEVLESMNVQGIPAPYEPGKYKVDRMVCGTILWLGVLAPPLTFIAHHMPAAEETVRRSLIPTGLNMTLIMVSVAFILVGAVAMLVWAMFAQAAVIANEGAERKRYLYRGFAEEIDDANECYRYLSYFRHVSGVYSVQK